jgi:hypothetical protein
MKKQDKKNEQTYPSVFFAYDIAIKSYNWAIQRSDAIDGSIDKLLAWITSITIGIIAIISGKEMFMSVYSIWFYLGMGSFIIAILIGVYSKVRGSLNLLSIGIIYEQYLHLGEWEFKKDIIYWAGEAFQKNQKYINWKGKLSIAMIIFFLMEVIFFAKWLIF